MEKAIEKEREKKGDEGGKTMEKTSKKEREERRKEGYEIQLSGVSGCQPSSRQLTSVGTHLMRIQQPTVVAGHGQRVLASMFLQRRCSCVMEKNLLTSRRVMVSSLSKIRRRRENEDDESSLIRGGERNCFGRRLCRSTTANENERKYVEPLPFLSLNL